jgi:hypothetical protein
MYWISYGLTGYLFLTRGGILLQVEITSLNKTTNRQVYKCSPLNFYIPTNCCLSSKQLTSMLPLIQLTSLLPLIQPTSLLPLNNQHHCYHWSTNITVTTDQPTSLLPLIQLTSHISFLVFQMCKSIRLIAGSSGHSIKSVRTQSLFAVCRLSQTLIKLYIN